MGVPLSLSDAVDLTDLAIQEIYLKQTQLEKKPVYSQYFNVVSGVTDYYSKDSSLSGLGQAARITENAVITAETPIQGYDKTYTQVEFGKLLPITKRMWKFGIKKRDLTRVVNALIGACERRREVLCADRLDNSFSTTYTVTDDSGNWTATVSGGDSVAAISSSHTREDGGTNWNNRITDGSTVNMDIDYDAIKAAHRTASLVKDAKGQLMNINLDTLITRKGHSSAFRAKELLVNIKAGGPRSMPSSAQNDAAAAPAYTVIENPWITTNTAYWWMFDSSMVNDEYGFQYKESQPIQMEGPNVVFKTGEIQYKTTMLFDIGFNDSRGWVGSKNTNAA
jgi:hypothetical protein